MRIWLLKSCRVVNKKHVRLYDATWLACVINDVHDVIGQDRGCYERKQTMASKQVFCPILSSKNPKKERKPVWKLVQRRFCVPIGQFHRCDGTCRVWWGKIVTCYSLSVLMSWSAAEVSCTMTHYMRLNDWIVHSDTDYRLRIPTTPYIKQIVA